MATNYPINPRIRALGKARLDIARRAHTPTDWEKLWKPPAHPFAFSWGVRWKQCVEYRVDDFAAEVGFYIDILGLPVNALDPDYAMFTSPTGDFYFAVVPADESASTPADAIRLQFMVANIFATVEELESRGIVFEQQPQPVRNGAALHIATFLTPHGICIDLWGELSSQRPSLPGIDEDEDIFLPGEEEDGELSLFTTQDAAPAANPLPRPHSTHPGLPHCPPLHPTIQALTDTDAEQEDGASDDLADDQEDLEEYLDSEQEDEDEDIDLTEDAGSSQDDDEIKYVDIDTA